MSPKPVQTTWREVFAPIIAGVLERHKHETPKSIRDNLRVAWERQRDKTTWKYRIWHDESIYQCQRLGLRGVVSANAKPRPPRRPKVRTTNNGGPLPGQFGLFGGEVGK